MKQKYYYTDWYCRAVNQWSKRPSFDFATTNMNYLLISGMMSSQNYSTDLPSTRTHPNQWITECMTLKCDYHHTQYFQQEHDWSCMLLCLLLNNVNNHRKIQQQQPEYMLAAHTCITYKITVPSNETLLTYLLTTRTSTCSQLTVRNSNSSEGKLSPMSLDAIAEALYIVPRRSDVNVTSADPCEMSVMSTQSQSFSDKPLYTASM